MDTMKITVVGDGAVGKTCLLLTYTTGSCPGEYIPTIFDNYNASVCVDGKLGSLSIWDTAGQEDYDRLRPLLYSGTDLFIACYSSCSPTSLANLQHKWLPEIRTHAGQGATIVLVATKTDAREDPKVLAKLRQLGLGPVSAEDGASFAALEGCAAFIECSSVSGRGVGEVFREATRCGRKVREAAARRQQAAARRAISGGFFGRVTGRIAQALRLRAA